MARDTKNSTFISIAPIAFNQSKIPLALKRLPPTFLYIENTCSKKTNTENQNTINIRINLFTKILSPQCDKIISVDLAI